MNLLNEIIRIKDRNLYPCKNKPKTIKSFKADNTIFGKFAFFTKWPMNFYLPIDTQMRPLNFLIQNWNIQDEIIIEQISKKGRLYGLTTINDFENIILYNGYMLEKVIENTHRSLYLDIDSKEINHEEILVTVINFIHKL